MLAHVLDEVPTLVNLTRGFPAVAIIIQVPNSLVAIVATIYPTYAIAEVVAVRHRVMAVIGQ
jgi:hypothetical protein